MELKDNKYYTPTIEEFHVGFEYEELWEVIGINEEWLKEIYDEHDSIGTLCETIRVKYLDKEDIESLGWNDIGSLWFENGDYKLRKWKDQSLDIYFEYADKETIMIFRGDVKNKSELKKLMEQLNIR